MPELPHIMHNILTLNQISPLGLDRFPNDHYQVSSNMVNPDAILVRSHNMLDMDIPANIVAIARAGAGTNNIPITSMNLRGIPVFNAPGANANAVKELVLLSMLLAARNIAPALNFTNNLTGDDAALHKQAEAEKKRFSGIELPGKTLGVIGLGEIGRLVADMAIKLRMKVIGYDPEITVDSAWSLSSEVKKAQNIKDLLRNSDFVSLHVPLLEVTRHLIDTENLNEMKSGSILLNFSRGEIVDEQAVLSAININRIKSYVCDFPSQALQHQENVITLPHLGASTKEAEENCAVMVVDQLMDYLQNGNITHAVNFPNITMERESPYRIAVANANVPNIVGQISTTMANAGLNIHNMTNKSLGEMAYTLVDVDSPIPDTVIDNIKNITGVLLTRYLPTHAS